MPQRRMRSTPARPHGLPAAAAACLARLTGVLASAARLAILTAVLAAASGLADEDAAATLRPAEPSALAARSLLLDVARAGDRLVAVGEWGHVVLSDDRGATWRQASAVPVRATLTSVHFSAARTGWAVGHDAVVLRTEDAGETWTLTHRAPALESPLLSVHVGKSGRGIAVGAFSLVLETRDDGRSWVRATPPGGEDADPHLNAVFADAKGVLWIAAEGGRVYRSGDGGATWTTHEPPYTGSFWNGLALPGGGVLVFGLRGHAFLSDDDGASWVRVHTGTDKSLTDGVVIGPDRVVLVGLGGEVLTSLDGGARFAPQTRPHRRSLTAVEAGPGGGLLLFGETGVERVPD